MSNLLDNVIEKIRDGLEGYDESLQQITDVQKVFLDMITSLFDVLVTLIKILVDILSNVAEAGPLLVLLIPALLILFVSAKVSQIL